MNKFWCNHITWWPWIFLISHTNTQGILIIVETDHMMIKDVLKSLKKISFLRSVLSKKETKSSFTSRRFVYVVLKRTYNGKSRLSSKCLLISVQLKTFHNKKLCMPCYQAAILEKMKKKNMIHMIIFQSSGIIFECNNK